MQLICSTVALEYQLRLRAQSAEVGRKASLASQLTEQAESALLAQPLQHFAAR